jgi:hypothetical protein
MTVPGPRSADQIQADIERSRASLAVAVDQLAYRTSPRNVAERVKTALIAKAQTPTGQKVIAGAGVVVLVIVVRRIRH